MGDTPGRASVRVSRSHTPLGTASVIRVDQATPRHAYQGRCCCPHQPQSSPPLSLTEVRSAHLLYVARFGGTVEHAGKCGTSRQTARSSSTATASCRRHWWATRSTVTQRTRNLRPKLSPTAASAVSLARAWFNPPPHTPPHRHTATTTLHRRHRHRHRHRHYLGRRMRDLTNRISINNDGYTVTRTLCSTTCRAARAPVHLDGPIETGPCHRMLNHHVVAMLLATFGNFWPKMMAALAVAGRLGASPAR